MSLASRNGIGVNRYTYRENQLAAVLRPSSTVDMSAIKEWFEKPYSELTAEGVRGGYYGWLDLLRFYSIKLATNGWICSEFVAKALRVGGINAFAKCYNEGTIDPGDYFVSPAFGWMWYRPDVYWELTT